MSGNIMPVLKNDEAETHNVPRELSNTSHGVEELPVAGSERVVDQLDHRVELQAYSVGVSVNNRGNVRKVNASSLSSRQHGADNVVDTSVIVQMVDGAIRGVVLNVQVGLTSFWRAFIDVMSGGPKTSESAV